MPFLKWFTGNVFLCSDLSDEAVIAERTTAIKNGSETEPFQRFRISQEPKVVQMSVFIRYDIIEHKHLIERRNDVRCIKCLAAIQKMLIERRAVILFLCLHDAPCADELCLSCYEVIANTVRFIILPNRSETGSIFGIYQ